jgi:xanthine dehydrogenase accessory protein XdhC
MNEWLTARLTEPAVLVTVAIVEGSGPREPGAKMLVTARGQVDTIGGGHLELCAVDTAREMLASGAPARLERYALGPALGQCCGGVVHLAFEVIDEALGSVLASVQQRVREDSWRLSAIDGPSAALLLDADGAVVAGEATSFPLIDRQRGTHILLDAEDRRWLADPCLAPRAHLLLFGAGHVGAAIIRMLGELPCTVTWIDERDDMFPQSIPANVTIEATDTPEALVDSAPGQCQLPRHDPQPRPRPAPERSHHRPRGRRLVRPDRLKNQARTVRAPPRRARPAARPHRRHGLSDRRGRHHQQTARCHRRLRVRPVADGVGSAANRRPRCRRSGAVTMRLVASR